jgi:transcriptional accessory protein Tex/SPT6
MGVILNQLDANTHLVTVAVVDKFGEVRAHQNFKKLLPPRRLKQPGGQYTEEDAQRYKKAQLSFKEEKDEHDRDKNKVSELIKKFEVDLIVVGASSLMARELKKTLADIAEKLKTFGSSSTDEAMQQLQNQSSSDQSISREAFVIWGSLEVPRLFANSYICQRLLKGVNDPVLKQAVSLARWQQDPLTETLNLWSCIPQEN